MNGAFKAPLRVSVILLSYKNTEYLKNCLDSIFAQTYENIEVICTNDGCDNFYVHNVHKYISLNKSDNITNFIVNKNEKNFGTVKHCNVALEMATGDYIMFISCDDEYNNANSIKDMVEGFCKAEPDVESIVGQAQMMCGNLDKAEHLFVAPCTAEAINTLSPMELYKNYLVKRCTLPAGAIIYKRCIFDKYGKFDETFFLIEDWSLAISHARQGMRSYFLDILCLNHRKGGISSSGLKSNNFAHKMYLKDHVTLRMMIAEDTENLDNITLDQINQTLAWYYFTYITLFNEKIERIANDVSFETKLINFDNQKEFFPEPGCKVAIFGYGIQGKKVFDVYQNQMQIVCFSDNNEMSWGGYTIKPRLFPQTNFTKSA